MKKLITAVAIVCAAAMAQAASISWNSGATKFVNNSTGATATSLGGSVCLIILDDNTGWSTGKWSAKAGSVDELATANLGTGKAAGKLTGNALQFTYGTSNPITDGDVLAVVFKDSKGAYNQLIYYSDKTAVTETMTVTGLSAQEDLYSETFTFGQGSAKSAGITSQAVPEPTSAMLLLLGMAGLALRRRRA